jgi:hypothetical protein
VSGFTRARSRIHPPTSSPLVLLLSARCPAAAHIYAQARANAHTHTRALAHKLTQILSFLFLPPKKKKTLSLSPTPLLSVSPLSFPPYLAAVIEPATVIEWQLAVQLTAHSKHPNSRGPVGHGSGAGRRRAAAMDWPQQGSQRATRPRRGGVSWRTRPHTPRQPGPHRLFIAMFLWLYMYVCM